MELNTILEQVKSWPPRDRLRLADAIWDGLGDGEADVALTNELKDVLDARIAEADQNPRGSISWEAIEASALARLKRCVGLSP